MHLEAGTSPDREKFLSYGQYVTVRPVGGRHGWCELYRMG